MALNPTLLQSFRWWDEEKSGGKPHDALFAVVRRIWDASAPRREGMIYDACLYDDAETIASIPGFSAYVARNPAVLTRNIVRPIVDTFTSSIGMNRPLPMPITTDGNYGQQKRARKLGQLIEGLFHKLRVFPTSRLIARDGGLWGTGITHNYRVGRELYHERVLPFELLVDPRDGMYGAPRNFYLRRWVDRLTLMERYPQFAADIEQADSAGFAGEMDFGYEPTSDLVLAVAGWHMPSSPGAGDGWYGFGVSSRMIALEPYERDYAPFGVFRCFPPSAGFFGSGLAWAARPAQYMINEQLIAWQEGMRRQSGFVVVDRQANVQPNHVIGGEYGVVLEYDRTPPQWITPQAVSGDVPDSIDRMVNAVFADAGISQLAAQQLKPAGIDSGEGLRAYNQMQTKRFAPQERDFEDYHITVANQLIDLMEEILEEYPEEPLEIRGAVAKGSGQLLSASDYREVRLDREQFTLLVLPTSALRRDPAGRIEDVQSLMKVGFFTPEEGAMLLELPDLDRLRNVKLSRRRIIEESVQMILDADEPAEVYSKVQPDGFMDLELAPILATLMYGDAKLRGADEENLAWVRQFILDATAKAEKADSANAQQPAAQAMAPGVDAMAPVPGDAVMPGTPNVPIAAPGAGAGEPTPLPPDGPATVAA